MSRTPVQLSAYDYQHAAEVALRGKLPVPPRVNPATCEAYLIELAEPTPDYFERDEHTHVVAVLARGEMGSYTYTISVLASDAEGNIAERDEDWVNMLDGGESFTHYRDKDIAAVLAEWGITPR